MKPMHFHSPDRFFSVILEPEVVRHVAQHAAVNHVETGGILIGKYSADGDIVTVIEASAKPRDSLVGRFAFQRGFQGLKALLTTRWDMGLFYVGEWHSHPGQSSRPSGPDLTAMRKIAANPKYQCQAPVLLIIGGKPPNEFSLSVTVFPANKQPVRFGVAP